MRQLSHEEILEARRLVEDLRKYRQSYYNNKPINNVPIIPDQVYNGMEMRLSQLIPNHPVLFEVGSTSDGFETYDYVSNGADKMLSLDKVHSYTDVFTFIGNRDYVAMMKLDGMSMRAVYNDGKLVLAHTRGNGNSGDILTNNFYFVKDSVPPNIDKSLFFEVRGEVCMTNADFEQINKEREKNGEILFSNPRNATALIKQKDFWEVAKTKLVFMAYVLKINNSPELNKRDQLILLEKMGFKTPWIKNFNSIKECIENLTEERDSLPINIDGIVFALNDVNIRKTLGCTNHHPRYEIAYKFPSEKGTTFLRDIQWNVTRTRRIVPTAVIDPIELSGAVCSRVTLNNAQWVIDNKLAIGEEVIVERANDVIPHLTKKVNSNSNVIVNVPEKCPSCFESLIQNSVDLECPNKNCKGALIEYLKFYVSKQVTNMEAIGDKLIDQLYESDLVKNPVDLYKLHSHKDKLIDLDRMGERKMEKILDSIEKVRNQSKEIFLISLGIDGLGKTVSKLVKDYIDLDRCVVTKSLDSIHGIGPIIARNIENGLKEKEVLIHQLLEEVKIITEKVVERTRKFNGESFCLTGKVVFAYNGEEYSEREKIQALIESLGGKCVSSVSKNLTYLLAGENTGGKLDKASQLGVKILFAEDFVKMIV